VKPYFQDDAVTIYHGDCREIVPGLGRFDLVLTDPPYGIGFGNKHTKWSANRGTILGNWDADTPDIYWLLSVAPLACIWGGERFALQVSRGWLAWIKPDAPPTFTALELAWTNRDVPARWIMHSISAMNHERVGHPTQKPLAVMAWSIHQVCPGAQTILDPFAGSGTTGRAAKDLGRKAVLIEREERYCEIAARRMGQEVLDLGAVGAASVELEQTPFFRVSHELMHQLPLRKVARRQIWPATAKRRREVRVPGYSTGSTIGNVHVALVRSPRRRDRLPKTVRELPATRTQGRERKVKAYIAGPMTGCVDFNFPAFFAAEAKLRKMGFDVVNPARNDIELDGFNPKTDKARPHWWYMRRALPLVCSCDVVVLLPGWERSRGTANERHVARLCNITEALIDGDGWLKELLARGKREG